MVDILYQPPNDASRTPAPWSAHFADDKVAWDASFRENVLAAAGHFLQQETNCVNGTSRTFLITNQPVYLAEVMGSAPMIACASRQAQESIRLIVLVRNPINRLLAGFNEVCNCRRMNRQKSNNYRCKRCKPASWIPEETDTCSLQCESVQSRAESELAHLSDPKYKGCNSLVAGNWTDLKRTYEECIHETRGAFFTRDTVAQGFYAAQLLTLYQWIPEKDVMLLSFEDFHSMKTPDESEALASARSQMARDAMLEFALQGRSKRVSGGGDGGDHGRNGGAFSKETINQFLRKSAAVQSPGDLPPPAPLPMAAGSTAAASAAGAGFWKNVNPNKRAVAERSKPSQSSALSFGVQYGDTREAVALVDGTNKEGATMKYLQWRTGGYSALTNPNNRSAIMFELKSGTAGRQRRAVGNKDADNGGASTRKTHAEGDSMIEQSLLHSASRPKKKSSKGVKKVATIPCSFKKRLLAIYAPHEGVLGELMKENHKRHPSLPPWRGWSETVACF